MSGFTKLSIATLVATLPITAANASAAINSVRVHTHDIDLSSARGQKILALRIDRAAREVCDFASDQMGPKVRKIERRCCNKAKASAMATIDLERRLGRR